MANSYARTVRGLSVASLVLSILAIIGCVLALVLLGVFGTVLSNSNIFDVSVGHLHDSASGMYYPLDSDTAQAWATFGLSITAIVIVLLALCAVPSLVAGILGIRNYNNPEKLSGAFGWSIAGAVLAFLSARIVTMVLLIVCAVNINRVRNAPSIPYGQPQPLYGQSAYGQPQPNQQPNQQPVQPQPPTIPYNLQ